jgi:hypothetical protein
MFWAPFGAILLAAGGDQGNARAVPQNLSVDNQIVVFVGGGESVQF